MGFQLKHENTIPMVRNTINSGGMGDYYLLSGDRHSKEMLVIAADWAIQYYNSRGITTSEPMAMFIGIMMAAYRVTGDVNYLNKVVSVMGYLYGDYQSTGGWSAAQTLGAPNTFGYGDISTAWAASSVDGGLEYVAVGYGTPVFANGVTVRETNCNGFVTKIELLDVSDTYHTVWQGQDPSQPGQPVDFEVTFPVTVYEVKGVRVTTDTTHVPGGWE